eukprot:TRINITY_DN45849_c0_g1_i2.p1 TRINITY_DN45849_c0_g1~~TRINITY_DN45849_c0_g1_i2.p1  ORF type:complete len:162 (-),score=3.71 TRINITY_DN45849_c0_g1_i2:30-473(-)
MMSTQTQKQEEKDVLQCEGCTYTKCYCEENVYFLCKKLVQENISQLDNLFVVFISNLNKKIPLWQQKSGEISNDYLVVWDYHVILIQQKNNFKNCNSSSSFRSKVWDPDTVLNFPCNFDEYSMHALQTQSILQTTFQRFLQQQSQRQ